MAELDLKKEIEETLRNLSALNMDGSELYLDLRVSITMQIFSASVQELLAKDSHLTSLMHFWVQNI